MTDGRLLFARYAFMPNRLGYCGGNENKALLDYCVDGAADRGLELLERQFQAAFPYLEFIAHCNGLANAFDPGVVEAYWLGNGLLGRVEMRDFHQYLADRVGPKLSKKSAELVLGKAPVGARPHHSFHVLDVSVRTGALRESIDDLDHCRISWGEVVRAEGDELVVSRPPLELAGNGWALGGPREGTVRYRVDGRGYLTEPEPGTLVSMHWDWACDVITPQQARRLERETRYHIALANQTR